MLDGLLREAGPPVSYLKCACSYKVLRLGAPLTTARMLLEHVGPTSWYKTGGLLE